MYSQKRCNVAERPVAVSKRAAKLSYLPARNPNLKELNQASLAIRVPTLKLLHCVLAPLCLELALAAVADQACVRFVLLLCFFLHLRS